MRRLTAPVLCFAGQHPDGSPLSGTAWAGRALCTSFMQAHPTATKPAKQGKGVGWTAGALGVTMADDDVKPPATVRGSAVSLSEPSSTATHPSMIHI